MRHSERPLAGMVICGVQIYLVSFLARQHRLGRDQRLVWDVLLTAPATSRHWEYQTNIGRIYVLTPR